MLLSEKRETYKGNVVEDANQYYNQNINLIDEENIPDVAAYKDEGTGHYVVTIGDNVFEMNDYATAANGVNSFLGVKSELTENLGEPIDIETLPESIKEAILERMKNGKVEESEMVSKGAKYMAEEIFYAPIKKKAKKTEEPKEKIEESSIVVEGTKWL